MDFLKSLAFDKSKPGFFIYWFQKFMEIQKFLT